MICKASRKQRWIKHVKKSQRRIFLLCCQNVEQHQTNGKGLALIPLWVIGIVYICERFLLKNFQLLVLKIIPKSIFWFYCTHVWWNSETFEHCTQNIDKSMFTVWTVAMVTKRLLWSMCWVRAWASLVVLMITGLAHSWRQAICKNNCSVPLHNVLVNSFPKQIKTFSTKLFFS